MNEEKCTPPKSESNTNEDDVWHFDNGASNHMIGNYSYFSELNENITGRVRFGDGSCVSIKGKGSIYFQGKNGEQKLLEDVYYIPALQSNVISLVQATIFGYDISTRGDFLTMRDSWGSLLIKVPRSANRLYKAQLKVGKEYTNEVGRESENDEEDESGSDGTPTPIAQLETTRLLIALAAGKGWKIHHLDVKMAFINGDRKKLNSILKEMGFLQCVHKNAVYKKVQNGEFIIVVIYGDDLFVTEPSLDLINAFQKRMASQFEISNHEAGMEDGIATLCPMVPILKLSIAEDEPQVEAT
ncbi:uncharacterized mitochondrial protein-like protein [Tanacetum coccineum]